jgi:hypothetical protein
VSVDLLPAAQNNTEEPNPSAGNDVESESSVPTTLSKQRRKREKKIVGDAPVVENPVDEEFLVQDQLVIVKLAYAPVYLR